MPIGIESQHPDYVEIARDYRVMADTFKGERRIKDEAFLYLPATSGMLEDGAMRGLATPGRKAYDAYKTRAVFPDVVREAVSVMVGVLHREKPVIKLPRALEPMRENATRRGESLDMLLRRINEQQLLFGRVGLLLDVADGEADAPHIVEYNARSIINWDDMRRSEFDRDELNFVVVDESKDVRNLVSEFTWERERRFRVLFLEPEFGFDETGAPVGEFLYHTAIEVENFRSEPVIPEFRGRPLGFLPFSFIGANDLSPMPDEIPLLGLANTALAIYRGEADYRQALFMTGQDTLVIQDDTDNDESDSGVRTGAGAVIRAPIDGDAKYIGINGSGIQEQRAALEALYARAREAGSRLLEPRGSQAESGEALRTRVAAQTSSLHQIALTSAAGLMRQLRFAALWMGANPNEVEIVPNTDFTEATEPPKTMVDLMEAKAAGAPLSRKSIHRFAAENDFTRMTFEEEQSELERERAEEEARRREAGEPPPGENPGAAVQTGVTDGHRHAWVPGEAFTSEVDGHRHAVSPGSAQTEEAGGHTHSLPAQDESQE